MTREAAVSLVYRLVDVARRRDLARIADCYADDAVAISPVFGEVRGRSDIVATWETLLSTFGDASVDISDVLVDANRVAVLSRITTTDRLGWFGRPATGGPLSYTLVLLLTIADGQIVRDERSEAAEELEQSGFEVH
jgi:ketosteroid isomerase-like protein